MQQEIEAKFLNVDLDDIRKRLKKSGAKCEQPMRLMRRVLFDHPDRRFQKINQSKRLRIRDEGDKVAVNYKEANNTNYVYEVEAVVESFEDMVKLFEAIGLEQYTYQESKRETWKLEETEVVLDEWPWLNPYIEIEGPTEKTIKQVAKKLGFKWEDAYFGSVDTAYCHQYPGMTETESISDVGTVKFDDPIPQFFLDRKKNRSTRGN